MNQPNYRVGLLLLCRHGLIDLRTDEPTICGVLDRVVVHNGLSDTPVSVVAEIEADAGQHDLTIVIEPLGIKGTPMRHPVKFRTVDRRKVKWLILPSGPVRFPHLGEHALRLCAGGAVLAERRFRVMEFGSLPNETET